MNVAKWIFTSVILFLLVGMTSSAFSAPSPAQAKPPTIYSLLMIADADPSIGRAVDVDRQRVGNMLKVAGGICNVQTDELLSSQGELKSEPVLQWIKNLSPEANDTVFIYYSGHGGMNKNKETFLYLQDGYFWRSKLVTAMEAIKKCRLKILMTDCCSDGPESETTTGRPPISKKALQDLFLGHEGFLHLSAASEGEYSWCSPKYGGWFTRAVIDSFDDSSDINMDGFVSWDEVLSLAVETVQKKFQQSMVYFSDEQKSDMKKKGIKTQTPKAYSMARRFDTSKIQQVTPDTSKKPEPVKETAKKPESTETLWSIDNPNSLFTVSIEPDKQKYDVGGTVTFHIQASTDCYLIIFNWNSKGEPMQLFPNKYESSNFAVKGKLYSIPSTDSKFDLLVSGVKGEEKIKIIALRNRPDSLKLRSLIPLEDSAGSSSTRISVVPRKTSTGDNTEAKILSAVKDLNPTDWATINCTLQIR
jgi:hypothetical protein